ncbi:DMT family transporter [Aliiroseovarius sp. KMU-50]|uniref:DMT family transporter n=1 Tax=Aliiroseovarius salicola TaxID=3009082 RepID=A0ABT4W3P6_9RHOB|nr:DMT family transporter [Aliiroseovarius sp. KMU-50]MDA5095044.1 DMT family transporter [Aliiroseovarius sp. KMU-50]
MDIRAIFMGLAFALMWSSAFTSARIIVADAPPLYSLALRFFISGLIGVAIAKALGQNWRLTRGQWKAVLVFGICQNALYLGLNFVAMQWIEASLAAIIASTMPLMVAFAGWALFGDRLRPMTALGLLAGVVGVALIMGVRMSGGVDLVGVALCFIGAAALTVATLAVRQASAGGNLMMIVGLQMFVGSFVLFACALFLESPSFTPSLRLAAAFSYTVLVPGLLATWVWFALVGRVGAVKAATFHFLNPFFGVAVAAVLLGEALGWLDILGVVIITIGILAVQLSKTQPKQLPTRI